ncbi:unnamed protein product [Acanthoscelides obtectus]|uniref:Uncharacterized protein n=1 Tax=Acanthoscelides obtectus TaxID=200917 RepID=A0A9P0M7N1_ACAOB|nr:unnamed protein product [Acanthoscelides obtectus]CAK1623173.1 hypothetical protein AOBTE_LOCUS1856 [Acanthoscelides obtectus]
MTSCVHLTQARMVRWNLYRFLLLIDSEKGAVILTSACQV